MLQVTATPASSVLEISRRLCGGPISTFLADPADIWEEIWQERGNFWHLRGNFLVSNRQLLLQRAVQPH